MNHPDMKNTTDIHLRPAEKEDAGVIWEILRDAIVRRRNEGSEQWQNGYPNPEVIRQDIDHRYGYVAIDPAGHILGYLSLSFDGEPAYEIEGVNWISDRPYGVVHRLAVSRNHPGKGIGTGMMLAVEQICIDHQIYSIKIDTNFDNLSMLRILEKLNFQYCGEVWINGASRKAFEKRLDKGKRV